MILVVLVVGGRGLNECLRGSCEYGERLVIVVVVIVVVIVVVVLMMVVSTVGCGCSSDVE